MDHGFRHAAMKPTVRPGAGVRDHDRQVHPILAGRGDNACGWLAAEYPGYGEDGETTRWPFMNGWTSHWK